jgi:hypothetical protein
MTTNSLYTTVGVNNRNALVQCKRTAPYNEDLTWKQGFDQTSVAPGVWNRIRVDLKHSGDRELIINDIRLRFRLNFQNAQRTNVGNVFAARGTDLIREFRVKINEDVVFYSDDKDELSHLWLMNNHRLSGESQDVRHSFLTNYGVIPRGFSPSFFYDEVATKSYFTNAGFTHYIDNQSLGHTVAELTQNAVEVHDGLPRLIYSDVNNANYFFKFDISLNQLIGPLFTRLHQRRIEYIQIEVRFQPWISTLDTQDFLLFATNPVKNVQYGTFGGTAVSQGTAAAFTDAVHPYSLANYDNMELVMFRSTFLDGIDGLTLPDNRMLSILMHRYSKRQYTIDLTNSGSKLEIPLKDFELRSNITRLYWSLDTHQFNTTNKTNYYYPPGEPCKGYEQLIGVELVWKNDKVLDLDTFFKVYRQYILAENKRYGLGDPHIRFQKLCPPANGTALKDNEVIHYTWDETARPLPGSGGPVDLWREHYEYPIYYVDFQMNILAGSPGAEIIAGLINDTNDYVIRLKRVLPDDDYSSTIPPFVHSGLANAKLNVWIEYQTLINLAAGSNQFNRASQTVTKQLNVQN